MKQRPTAPFHLEGWIISQADKGLRVERIDDVAEYRAGNDLFGVPVPQLQSDAEAYKLAKIRFIYLDAEGYLPENFFKLNYDTKNLTLMFEGQIYYFSLDNEDVGDVWNSFTDAEGIQWDINFSQEEESDAPSLAVYSLEVNEKGIFEIDTSTYHTIKASAVVGNPRNYFGDPIVYPEPVPELVYMVRHEHQYGETVELVKTVREIGGFLNQDQDEDPTPEQLKLIEFLALDYEPERGESINIDIIDLTKLKTF